MANRYRAAAVRAKNMTNEKYALEISTLTRLTEQQIKQLFPGRTDKDKLLVLLAVVNESESQNKKVNKLLKMMGDLAPVIIKLIKLLV